MHLLIHLFIQPNLSAYMCVCVRHCDSKGESLMEHTVNDSGTQHLVINEEMEDQRKKMMTLYVYVCVCI